MTEARFYPKWRVDPADLAGLTPRKTRDLLSVCFFEAQKETFARAKKRLGLPAEEDHIRDSVVTAVRMAFLETGGDFENPTKSSLLKVIQYLADKSTAFGTPPDIIHHHRHQMEEVIQRLP